MDSITERLEARSPDRRTAKVREVLILAEKILCAAYAVQPGRYSIRRRLQLSGLHLDGEELVGGDDAEGGVSRNKAEAERVVV